MTKGFGGSPPRNTKYSSSLEESRAILAKHTIVLDDPGEWRLERARKRRQHFQTLVNQFYEQIRYGCKNPNCETPTCLSCRKRLAKGPYRRFAVFSARTLACTLANEDHPERHLCPHSPIKGTFPVKVDVIADHPPHRDVVKGSRATSEVSRTRTLIPIKETTGHKKQDTLEGAELLGRNKDNKPPPELDNSRKTKDPRSFTQNLFDTFSFTSLFQKVDFTAYSRWLYSSSTSPDSSEAHQVDTRSSLEPSATNMRRHEIHENDRNNSPQHGAEGHDRTKGTTEQEEKGMTGRRNVQSGDFSGSRTKRKRRNTTIREHDLKLPNGDHGTRPAKISVPTSISIIETVSEQNQAFDFTPTVDADDTVHEQGGLTYLTPHTSLSHFSNRLVSSLCELVNSTRKMEFGEEVARDHFDSGLLMTVQVPRSISSLDNTRAAAFAMQSLTYVLSSPQALLRSFKIAVEEDSSKTALAHAETASPLQILDAFCDLGFHDPDHLIIHPSLWIALGDTFAFDPLISRPSVLKQNESVNVEDKVCVDGARYRTKAVPRIPMNDVDAAHIFKIVLAALNASVPFCSPFLWSTVVDLRASGQVTPNYNGLESYAKKDKDAREIQETMLRTMNAFQNDLSMSLATRLVRAYATRRCWAKISETRTAGHTVHTKHTGAETDLPDLLMGFLKADYEREEEWRNERRIFRKRSRCRWNAFSMTMLEWLRGIILREWNGQAEIPRWGAIGGAIDLMSYLYESHRLLGLTPEDFYTPYISDRLNPMEMPVEWVTSQTERQTAHILSYSFLFLPSVLVSYFRAINHAAMYKAFEASMVNTRLVMTMAMIAGKAESRLFGKMKTAMMNYLVLEIRRDSVLPDALNQLWRREKRELLRPLKIRMGMDEGEEGVDHGGVQQEFFRIALSEALNPDYGMFTLDSYTRMSWFQPFAVEPLYKYELLGLLVSLAVYNGLTLPMTFPIALYRKLLDLPVTNLSHVQDGWPDLTKGLDDLLHWNDGDVADVFVRNYVFSVEVLGTVVSIDMEKDDAYDALMDAQSATVHHKARSPDSPSTPERVRSPIDSRSDHNVVPSGAKSTASDVGVVTNANRVKYIDDYISWLTDRSMKSQYEAFARGFFVCFDKKALSLFTPEALQKVIEGVQEVNIKELRKITRYEGGYHAEHRTIKDFWHVIEDFSTQEIRCLLEFVTASDRIPVNGVRSILFVVQRNGTDDERLPTSLTCFGRLLLPEYSSREKLRDRVLLAIENSRGFGVP